MILNLRGPSGSGKSYPGFQLLKEYGPPIEEIRSTDYFNRKRPKLIGQVLPGGLCLAGRYTMKKSTVKEGAGYSGGVDGFFPVEELQQMLTDLSDQYPHMLVESLMISGTFERWSDWAHERAQAGNPVTFATLDTPLELCLERVQQRNGGKPVKEDTIAKHRRQVHRCARRLQDEGGHRSLLLDHTQSYEGVKQLLFEGGWDPS